MSDWMRNMIDWWRSERNERKKHALYHLFGAILIFVQGVWLMSGLLH